MYKNNTKSKYDRIRAQVIADLAKESGLSVTFVRAAVKGDRKSLTAEKIKREFNNRYNRVQQVLKGG